MFCSFSKDCASDLGLWQGRSFLRWWAALLGVSLLGVAACNDQISPGSQPQSQAAEQPVALIALVEPEGAGRCFYLAEPDTVLKRDALSLNDTVLERSDASVPDARDELWLDTLWSLEVPSPETRARLEESLRASTLELPAYLRRFLNSMVVMDLLKESGAFCEDVLKRQAATEVPALALVPLSERKMWFLHGFFCLLTAVSTQFGECGARVEGAKKIRSWDQPPIERPKH